MIRYNPIFLYNDKRTQALRRWHSLQNYIDNKIKRNSMDVSSLITPPKESYLLGRLPKGTAMEQHMYLKLSSLRNYFDYNQSNEVTLPTVVALDYYSKLQILTNRLLIVKDEKIYFKNEAI